MTTISIPRRRSSLVPRAAALVAVLLVLLGIATVVHARSVARPTTTAPAVFQTTVPDFPVVPPIRHGRGASGVTGAGAGALALVDRNATGGSAEAHRLGGRSIQGPAVSAPQATHGTHADQYPTYPQLSPRGRRGADL
jgi:hypothetical protein